MTRGRDFDCVDTLGTLSDSTLAAVGAESVRIVRRAAMQRALRIVRRAEANKAKHRHEVTPTIDCELERAQAQLADAVARYLGEEDDDV